MAFVSACRPPAAEPSSGRVAVRDATVSQPETPAGVWRVRDRSTFGELRRHGRRSRSRLMTVTHLSDGDGPITPPRLAFAVSRAVGTSPMRNRLRRVLRDEARTLSSTGEMPRGAWLVRLSPAASRVPGDRLRDQFRTHVADLTSTMVPTTPPETSCGSPMVGGTSVPPAPQVTQTDATVRGGGR